MDKVATFVSSSKLVTTKGDDDGCENVENAEPQTRLCSGRTVAISIVEVCEDDKCQIMINDVLLLCHRCDHLLR
jgi:hypothetical protein